MIKGLGFTRLNQVIEREDTPSIRGMVAKVPHLVEIVEVAGSQSRVIRLRAQRHGLIEM